MKKMCDMDEISLLNQRFNTLIDKVRCLTDDTPPTCSSCTRGCKAYTVNVSGAVARDRQKELIKMIDDALNQIASAVSSEMDPPSRYQHGKKVFTVEELLFLETKLRTFQSVFSDKVPSDG